MEWWNGDCVEWWNGDGVEWWNGDCVEWWNGDSVVLTKTGVNPPEGAGVEDTNGERVE